MYKAEIRLGAQTESTISPYIYGAFAEHLGRCVYDGIYVGEDSKIPNIRGLRTSIVDAFSEIKLPVLRWPGGCFASYYHWKDGIGPKETRPRYENNNMWHDVEDNSFGTHEFMDFCALIGAEPYIAGNLSSGTVQEMRDWVEYLTHPYDTPMTRLRRQNGREEPWRVKFWGLGNEAWGEDGNMRPDYYCDVARQYSSFCNNYSETDELFKVFVGPHMDDYEWTDYIMNVSYPYQPNGHWGRGLMHGISIHCYTYAGEYFKSSADIDFTDDQWNTIMKGSEFYDELLTKHSGIMDRQDPEKEIQIVFDEWGTWFAQRFGSHPEAPFHNTWYLEQQNTMRDAVFAARAFDVFNRHCGRVEIAAIAQAVNVLQALVLTEGADSILTPTYHIFKMYMPHRGGKLVSGTLDVEPTASSKGSFSPVSFSASEHDEGVFISLSNGHISEDCEIAVSLPDGCDEAAVHAEILFSEQANDHNTFDDPEKIRPMPFSSFAYVGHKLVFNLPAHSIVSAKINRR